MINRQELLFSLYTKWIFTIYLFSQVFFPYTIINRLAMVLFFAMVILLCLSKKKIYFHAYFLFTLLFIIQSYIFTVRGISIDSQTSLTMTSTIILNFLVALAIYNYILINDNFINSLYSFSKISLLFTVYIVMLSLGQIFSGRLGSDINLNILGSVVTYNSNTVAMVAGFTYFIYLYKYNNNKNLLDLCLLLWLVIIVLLTGSRKGLLLLFFGTSALIFILNPKKLFRNILITSIVSIALYWVLMNIPLFYNIAGFRMEALLNIILGEEVDEASANTRNLYIERGWEYFLQKPWTGYGLDNFRNLPGSYGTYSHNNYIELLVSGGIPAFIFYYGIRIIVLIKLFINRNKFQINKLLFIILLALLIVEYGFVAYYERIYLLLFVFVICGDIRKKIQM
jgi:O-antigen ligase